MSNKANKKNDRRLLQPVGGPETRLVISNYKEIGKGSLVGTCDILVARWRLVLRGCLHFEKNGKGWVSLPTKEFTLADGTRKFTPMAEFRDSADSRRFSLAALEAIETLTSRAAPSPRPPNRRAASDFYTPNRSTSDPGPPDDSVDDLWRAEP